MGSVASGEGGRGLQTAQAAPNSRGEPVSGNSGVVGLPVGSIKRVICV